MERERSDRRAFVLCVPMAAGGAAVILLGPVWHLPARAALVPAPDANVVYAALYVVMACAYLWKKLR